MKFIALVAVAMLATIAASGDSSGGPKKNQVSISPFISHLIPDDGYNADPTTGPGIAVGYSFTDNWMVEAMYADQETDYNIGGITGHDDLKLGFIDLLYAPDAGESKWRPFLLVGAGQAEYNYDSVTKDNDDTTVALGFGVFRRISEHVSFRGDFRGLHGSDEGGFAPMLNLGLTGFLGGAPTAPPVDTDGDGVPDINDKCPNTPPGVDVGADGCELDSDGDGVVDSKDACPDTPKGVSVDSRGCPLDSDGDGVPDYLDECPDSEKGAKVDEKGCYVELDETVTIDLNLEFDTNSAELRTAHYSEIQRVVNFLIQYPTANAVIEGHTDSSGAESYNQALSERRAKSVMEDLISRGNVRASRLSSAGFGESRPIASNDTATGKQKNRRVSAVVSGTHTVRQ